MAEEKFPLLHLEAVEVPQNEGKESGKTGHAPVADLRKRKFPKRLFCNNPTVLNGTFLTTSVLHGKSSSIPAPAN